MVSDGGERRDDAPGAHDRHAVGVANDLVQLVRDEDDRAAAGGELAHGLEEGLDFGRREVGRWLVQDDQVGAVVQQLDQLDALASPKRQIPDGLSGSIGSR